MLPLLIRPVQMLGSITRRDTADGYEIWFNMIGLGFALLPFEKERVRLQMLTENLAQAGVRFSFALHEETTSLPHISLMQGVFLDTSSAIEAVRPLVTDSPIDVRLRVDQLDVWATKILFLNVHLEPWLENLHRGAFASWQPIMQSVSADPQSFRGITASQRASFERTGYPFALDEYLPHFTLGHLQDGKATDKDSQVFADCDLPDTIAIEQMIVFEVEPRGVCRKIVASWPLADRAKEPAL